jgi:hypothetical protein
MKSMLAIIILCVNGWACVESITAKPDYHWELVAESAAFKKSYNYPVFIMNGEMIALNDGGWSSKDGKNWANTGLKRSGLNSAFQRYVQFNGAIYSLGTMEGNIEKMKLGSRIARTSDGRSWEVIAANSNLPERVFYAAIAFKEKIWLFGGSMNGQEFADVWNSPDGIHWQKVADNMPWKSISGSPRVALFKGKLFLMGDSEVWDSADGINWKRVTPKMARNPVFISGYSIAEFDGKLWLAGINRNNTFDSGLLYTENGKDWHEMNAPWSPRGAVAVWVYGDKMYLTGGKYSYVEKVETKFVYSNDVWVMSRAKIGLQGETR